MLCALCLCMCTKVQIWLQNFSEEVLERMELDRKQVCNVLQYTHTHTHTHNQTGGSGVDNWPQLQQVLLAGSWRV